MSEIKPGTPTEEDRQWALDETIKQLREELEDTKKVMHVASKVNTQTVKRLKYEEEKRKDDNWRNFQKIEKLEEELKSYRDALKILPKDQWWEEMGEVIWIHEEEGWPLIIASPLNTEWDEEEMEPYKVFIQMPLILTQDVKEAIKLQKEGDLQT